MIVHRVLSPVGGISRYSVPFFFNQRLDTCMRAINIVHRYHQGFTGVMNVLSEGVQLVRAAVLKAEVHVNDVSRTCSRPAGF